MIEVVRSARHGGFEPVVAQGLERFHQLQMSREKWVHRLLPLLLAGSPDRWPVIFLRHRGPRRNRRSLHRAQAEFHPCLHVQDQFPDGVNIRDRTRFRLLSSYVVQDFAQRVSVPGLSIDGGSQSVSGAIAFSCHKKIKPQRTLRTQREKRHHRTRKALRKNGPIQNQPVTIFISAPSAISAVDLDSLAFFDLCGKSDPLRPYVLPRINQSRGNLLR